MLFFILVILKVADCRVDTGADFLKFITGARNAGMGAPFVAIADDPSTLHYNPAGMLNLDTSELLSMYSQAIMGANYEYIGYIERDKKNPNGWGLHLIYYHLPKLSITDIRGEELGKLKYRDLALGLSYAHKIRRKDKGSLYLGLTTKYIKRSFIFEGISEAELGSLYGLKKRKTKGETFCFDLGWLLFITDKLRLGVTLQNWGPKVKFKDKEQADPLPHGIIAGVAYYTKDIKAGISFQRHIGLSQETLALPPPFTGIKVKAEWNAGVEYWLYNILALRVGYYSREGALFGATYGAGIRLGKYFQFDFADIPSGELGRIRQGSLILKF